jgi:hypothetical protein
MDKKIIAFILGFLSFFLMFILGEGIGIYAAFIGMGIYYLISQYFLSRGNPQALFKDWLIILSLNSTLIVASVLILFVEQSGKMQSLIVIVSTVSSVAGAGLAAWLAKKSNYDAPNP